MFLPKFQETTQPSLTLPVNYQEVVAKISLSYLAFPENNEHFLNHKNMSESKVRA